MTEIVLVLTLVAIVLAGWVRWREYQSEMRASMGVISKLKGRKAGIIYFVRGRGESPFSIKCGKTIGIDNRMGNAQTYISPHGLFVSSCCFVQNVDEAENWVKKTFSDERIHPRREWYRRSIRMILFELAIRNSQFSRKVRKQWSS